MLARWAGGGMVIYADKVGWRGSGNICRQGCLKGIGQYMLARLADGEWGNICRQGWLKGGGNICRRGGLVS